MADLPTFLSTLVLGLQEPGTPSAYREGTGGVNQTRQPQNKLASDSTILEVTLPSGRSPHPTILQPVPPAPGRCHARGDLQPRGRRLEAICPAGSGASADGDPTAVSTRQIPVRNALLTTVQKHIHIYTYSSLEGITSIVCTRHLRKRDIGSLAGGHTTRSSGTGIRRLEAPAPPQWER